MKTNPGELRWASTTRVVMEEMKKMMWEMPPKSSNALRTCLNHRLDTKRIAISAHMVKEVCHAFGS